MLFSIIVPVYNIADYLGECISSVLNQDCDCFELILVDDGSTDDSLSVCKSYALTDNRIKIIAKENEGVSKTRLRGALEAEGEYIINLDGDDILAEHSLSELKDIVIAYRPDALFFDMESFGSNSIYLQKNMIEEGFYEENDIRKIASGYIYDRSLPGLNSGNILPSAGGKVIKRELYIKSIRYSPRDIFQGEDLIQNLKVILESQSLYVKHKAYYRYRTRETSVSCNVTLAHLDNVFNIYEFLIRNHKELMNQSSAYLVIRLWDIVANLYKKKTPFVQMFCRIKKTYTLYTKELKSIKWGELSTFDRIKVLIVTRGLRLCWMIALKMKY